MPPPHNERVRAVAKQEEGKLALGLVAELLEGLGLTQTLSVFLPEANLLRPPPSTEQGQGQGQQHWQSPTQRREQAQALGLDAETCAEDPLLLLWVRRQLAAQQTRSSGAAEEEEESGARRFPQAADTTLFVTGLQEAQEEEGEEIEEEIEEEAIAYKDEEEKAGEEEQDEEEEGDGRYLLCVSGKRSRTRMKKRNSHIHTPFSCIYREGEHVATWPAGGGDGGSALDTSTGTGLESLEGLLRDQVRGLLGFSWMRIQWVGRKAHF